MSPEHQTTVMETVEGLMEEAFPNGHSGHNIGYESLLDEDVAVDLTDGSIPRTLGDAQNEDEDLGIAESLIDGALRRAADIFSESRIRADQVVEDAHSRALVIVSGAEDFADELIAWTRADAEEQVQEVFRLSRAKAARMIAAADVTIEERKTCADETLAAVASLADNRIAEAKTAAAVIIEQATAAAEVVQDESTQEARVLLLDAQAKGDRLVTNAQSQADEILVSVEELRATAHARLSAAADAAAERGKESARREIEAQLIDTRREIEELEARAAVIRQELAEAEEGTVYPGRESVDPQSPSLCDG